MNSRGFDKNQFKYLRHHIRGDFHQPVTDRSRRERLIILQPLHCARIEFISCKATDLNCENFQNETQQREEWAFFPNVSHLGNEWESG